MTYCRDDEQWPGITTIRLEVNGIAPFVNRVIAGEAERIYI
jgi:hypothetical protein